MFRLLTTSVPALVLCLGAANAASTAPLEPLWGLSHSQLNPTEQHSILPGGCYVPGPAGTPACPSGWCGTGYGPRPLDLPASECPNGLEDVAPYWPGANPAAPYVGSRPGAVHSLPALPGYVRPLPDRPWPQQYLPAAGMFEADYPLRSSDHLHDDLDHRRPPLRPHFNQPQRQVPGDFHILPVSRETSDWFTHDSLRRP